MLWVIDKTDIGALAYSFKCYLQNHLPMKFSAMKQILSGRRYHHPGLVPWVFMILSILILMALGAWQLQRLGWKEQLLHNIEAGQQLVPLMQLPSNEDGMEGSLENALYRRVKLTTDLNRHDYFLRVGVHRDLGKGYYVLSPIPLTTDTQILVNRGFIAGETQAVKDALAAEELNNPTVIEGIIRPTYKPRLFSPSNHPDINIWFSEDVEAMKQSLMGTWSADEQHADFNYVPYVIEVTIENPMKGTPTPKPNNQKPRLRNDHLGYAVTWFGLALVGVVMFWFYCYRREEGCSAE